MSSFGAVTFTVLSEGFSEPATASVTVRGFPGGNNWAISLGGQRAVSRTMACLFATRAAYTSFVLLRGTEANLTVDTWDTFPVSAVLQECSADSLLPTGHVRASATFVLV